MVAQAMVVTPPPMQASAHRKLLAAPPFYTFDSLPLNVAVPASYTGINLGTGAATFVVTDAKPGSKYAYAAVSGARIISNAAGKPVTMTIAAGATFKLSIFFVTGLATSSMTLTVTGSRGGKAIAGASKTVTLAAYNRKQAVVLPTAFAAVDSVTFTPKASSSPRGIVEHAT
jgi:hypothetical protein